VVDVVIGVVVVVPTDPAPPALPVKKLVGMFETLFDVKARAVEPPVGVVPLGFVGPPTDPDDPAPPPTLPINWFPVTAA
jgi:hypothetical protein